jgi:hypothetical protein
MTAQIRKYTDWTSWWFGLRTNLIAAAGTSITTLIGSNGIAAMNIPGLKGIGMDWKTAVVQFLLHILIAAGAYMKANQPTVVSEEVNTVTTTTTKTETPKPTDQ